jgi:hypothetical protein
MDGSGVAGDRQGYLFSWLTMLDHGLRHFMVSIRQAGRHLGSASQGLFWTLRAGWRMTAAVATPFSLGPKSASVKETARDGNLSSSFQRRDPIPDILAIL